MKLFDFLKPGALSSPDPNVPVPSIPRYTTQYGLQIPFVEYNTFPYLTDLSPRIVRQDLNTYIPFLPYTNDSFVEAMHAARRDIIFITPYVYTHTVTDDMISMPPKFKTPAGLAAYMETIAAKYAGRVKGYEITNEPNAPAGSNGDSRSYTPAEYMQFLVPTSTAIRKQDPTVSIIGACTSGMALNWHRELAALGAAKYVNFISFHPYGESVRSISNSVLSLQQIWGDKPLMCTEYGDADAAKAIAIHKALSGLVHTSILFNLRGDPYGLIDSSGAKRTSYAEAKALFARNGAA